MADNVAVTAGTGTTIAADEVNDGTLGIVKVQFVKIMDGTLDGTTKAGVGANGLKVDGSGVTQPVSGTVSVNALPTGSNVVGKVSIDQTTPGTTNAVAQSGTWTVQPGNTANTTAWKVDGSAVTQPISASSLPLPTNAANAVAQASTTSGQTGTLVQGAVTTSNPSYTTAQTSPLSMDTAGNVRVTVNPNQLSTLGQAVMASSVPVTIASNQNWPTGVSSKGFSAAFSTLTRPANTTAYSAGDSISDNATAGSVTALSATVSDTNDDSILLTEVLISSTDTGLAGKRIRAYLFNSDPTASTGVGAGDNAAYSQKKAGYIGSMSGVLETGFSDGTVGRLTPSFNDSATAPVPNAAAGSFIVTKPTSGAKTLYIQYQAMDAFTPSANSTTIIGTVRGIQARAG